MIFRPSAAHRWMTCAMSQVQAATRPETENDAAREGTCAAWVAEMVINGDASPDDMLGETHENGWEVDADMVRHVADYVGVVSRGDAMPGRAEVFVKTDYGLQGTADHVQWKHGYSMLWITDLKYGYKTVEARDNWQLLCYLFLVLSTMPRDHWPQLVQLSIYQPRALHRDGPYRKWVLSRAEYEPYMAQIYQRIAAIQAGEASAHAGPHCYECALAAGCEALTHSTYNIVDYLQSSRVYRDPTGQQLGDELTMLDAMTETMKARHNAVQAEAEARIEEGQMVPGWCLEKRYGKKKFTVDPVAIQMITGIDPTDDGVCTPAELIRRGADRATVNSITTTPFIGVKLGKFDSDEVAAQFAAAQKGTAHG